MTSQPALRRAFIPLRRRQDLRPGLQTGDLWLLDYARNIRSALMNVACKWQVLCHNPADQCSGCRKEHGEGGPINGADHQNALVGGPSAQEWTSIRNGIGRGVAKEWRACS